MVAKPGAAMKFSTTPLVTQLPSRATSMAWVSSGVTSRSWRRLMTADS